jgi:hypothetical protein
MGHRTHHDHASQGETTATRLMGGLFAVGATGFVVGPLDVYTRWVGPPADALTFFAASILFTGGGLAQARLAYPERQQADRAGALAWRGAWIQLIGTLLFNLMTFEAISPPSSAVRYDALVWAPDALGSVCFLISGILLYLSAPPEGWRPSRRAPGWWEPPTNLLGCALFGVSAVAGLATTSASQLLDTSADNWTTTFGAICFLAVGLAPLIAGMTFKVPRLSRLKDVEHGLEQEADAVEQSLESEIAGVAGAGRAAMWSIRARERDAAPEGQTD